MRDIKIVASPFSRANLTETPSDPVARRVVDSLARPGGNITGFYSMADVLAGKRVEALDNSAAVATGKRKPLSPRETG